MDRSTPPSITPPALSAAFFPSLVRHLPEAEVRRAAAASRRIGPPRERKVPRHFVLWLSVAAAIFSRHPFTQVARLLIPGFAADRLPSSSVLAQGRARLGWLPLRELARRIVRPLATLLGTPDAFHRGLRLLAVDGATLSLPDTPANGRAFGYARNQHRGSHFPRLRIAALCELGTHAVLRWITKPWRVSEVPMARALIPFLEAGQLLLHDCNFFGFPFWKAAISRGAHLLGRVQTGPLLRPRTRLADGSYTARMYPTTQDRLRDTGGIDVRVVEYVHRDPDRVRCGARTRLVTTLLDPATDPAQTLIALYHRRWDQELAFDEIKTHLADRAVELRSRTPVGVLQDLSALLVGHWVLRAAMVEAGELAGVDPLALSFTGTLRIVQIHLREAPADDAGTEFRDWWKGLLGEIAGTELPPKRNRLYPRVIKAGRNKFPSKKKHHRERAAKPFADWVEVAN